VKDVNPPDAMPIRVRAKAQPTLRDLSPVSNARLDFDLPDITADDDFRQVVRKISW
jgi:hypothetical protein